MYQTLVEASAAGNSTVVYEELKNGKDPNYQDADGWTPLMLACRAEQAKWDSSEVILNDYDKLATMKRSYQSMEETPLGSVLLLLRYGARLDIVNKDNMTALDYVYDLIAKRVIKGYGDLCRTACKPGIQAYFDSITLAPEMVRKRLRNH